MRVVKRYWGVVCLDQHVVDVMPNAPSMTGALEIYIKNKTALAQQQYMEELVKARTAVIENQKKNLEEINIELDQKNKKIEEQKEKLLILHSDLKNENFEIEKFKTFMLAEFQKPISEIIKVSGSFKKETETHRNLVVQTSKLVNLISEWNYLEHVKDLGPIKKTTAYLFPVLKISGAA